MAKNKKYLVVYNTCGISGKDNSDYYVDAISTINKQKFKNYKLAVSSCQNPEYQIEKILQNCKVDYINAIEDVLPVNITFNDTVRECIKHYGDFEAFLYLDSGIKFTNENQLGDLIEMYESGNYGMVSAQVDNDFGWCWFGLDEYSRPVLRRDMLIPIGKACNLHCQVFSKEIYEHYGNVIPDIFRSYCTESTFSFINASLKKQWAVASKVRVHHAFKVPDGMPDAGDGLDGHSSGFRAPPGTWDDIYPPHTMKEIISLQEGTDCGFGYEELRGIKLHKKECFDDNFYCKNNDLKDFLKKYLYRSIEDFDYEKINKQIIVN